MQSPGYTPAPKFVRRELDFGMIGDAWQMIMGNIWPFVVWSVVVMIGQFAFSFINQMISIAFNFSNPSTQEEALGRAGLAYVASLPVSLMSAAFIAVMAGGLIVMALKEIRGEKAEFGDIFSGFSSGAIHLAIAGFLIQLAAGFGFCLCIIPGLLLYGLFMTTFPFIVDQKMTAIDAMKASFNLIRDQMWMALGVYLVAIICSILGLIACCIGIVVTLPIVYIVSALAYASLTGYGMGGQVDPMSNYPRGPVAPTSTPEQPAPYSAGEPKPYEAPAPYVPVEPTAPVDQSGGYTPPAPYVPEEPAGPAEPAGGYTPPAPYTPVEPEQPTGGYTPPPSYTPIEPEAPAPVAEVPAPEMPVVEPEVVEEQPEQKRKDDDLLPPPSQP